jgi:endonuclease/exonuclease/phosphatase family metal-dependent hydrolase
MPDGRERPAGQLRVVQLNAGSLLEPRWPERRVEVVAWLERLQPDVVCLEEIHEGPSAPNTAGWIVDQLEDGWHWSFGGDGFAPEVWPEPELRFGSAILSRWPIERSGYRRLPLAPGAAGFLTAVPWELVHVRTAGLDVFACHLAAAPQDGLHRRAQVLEIDRYVREVRGDLDAPPAGVGHTRSAMPAILCGDFNAEPESDEIRFLSSLTAIDGRTTFWQDAWRVAGDGPGLTQDWRTNPIAAALNVHRKRIDYVFVGDPFLRDGGAGRVLAAEVAFDEPLTGVLASDHAGLVVDVAWPGRPPLP